MIDGKIIVWILAFAFVVAAAGLVVHTSEIDELNRDLHHLRSSNDGLQSLITVKEQTLAQRASEAAAAQKQIQALETLDANINKVFEERNATKLKLQKIEDNHVRLTEQLREQIQLARKTAVGEKLGDVKPRTGPALADASIQKITDTDITLIHAGGVVKLPTKIAPADLVKRFRLMTEAEIEEARQKLAASSTDPLDPALIESLKNPPPSAPNASGDGTAQIKSSADQLAQAQKIASQISELRTKILVAENQKREWLRQASEYRDLHSRAQYLGRSSSHLIRANDATTRANTIQKQIDEASIIIEKFRSRIDSGSSISN